ncbi:hypothetical protein LEMLEM_LOCUS10553 [Lemmus lemmus]
MTHKQRSTTRVAQSMDSSRSATNIGARVARFPSLRTSVTFPVMTYWMMTLPMTKSVLRRSWPSKESTTGWLTSLCALRGWNSGAARSCELLMSLSLLSRVLEPLLPKAASVWLFLLP